MGHNHNRDFEAIGVNVILNHYLNPKRHVQLPTRFDPLAWHVHEMLFNFVMAAVADFLLLLVTGACWIAAFGLFELVYGPMLLTQRSTS